MEELSKFSSLILFFVTATIGLLSFLLFNMLWLRPEMIRNKLRSQGINGPPSSLIFGNILEMNRIIQEEKNVNKDHRQHITDNYAFTVFPYFTQWRKKYGPVFFYSTGTMQILHVSRPDIAKEISLCKSLDFGKPLYLQKERGPLLGKSILSANGALWAYERKVLAPELMMNKVKGFVNLILESAIMLLDSWESLVENAEDSSEIIIDGYLRNFAADVISRITFGTDFAEGKEIFSRIMELQKIMAKTGVPIGIPGTRYLPTQHNRRIWRLNQEIQTLIMNMTKEHGGGFSGSNGKDLLQAIIESSNAEIPDSVSGKDFIVDNCKSIFFAGHETTASTATWCLMLLASYPEWQSRARDEVLDVCQGRFPDFEMLRKLKTLTMVIQETLRLYPSVPIISRHALQDIKLGELLVPKGTNVSLPTSALHHDTENWGPDAGEFRPDRFLNGISGACRFPHTYIPFGLGLRTCAGQNLATIELKIILSFILSKFTFALSPRYHHSPAFRLTIEPEFGVPLVVKKL